MNSYETFSITNEKNAFFQLLEFEQKCASVFATNNTKIISDHNTTPQGNSETQSEKL